MSKAREQLDAHGACCDWLSIFAERLLDAIEEAHQVLRFAKGRLHDTAAQLHAIDILERAQEGNDE